MSMSDCYITLLCLLLKGLTFQLAEGLIFNLLTNSNSTDSLRGMNLISNNIKCSISTTRAEQHLKCADSAQYCL